MRYIFYFIYFSIFETGSYVLLAVLELINNHLPHLLRVGVKEHTTLLSESVIVV